MIVRGPFQVFKKYTQAQTNAEVLGAQGAGTFITITDISASNGNDAIGYFSLLDGSGGSVVWASWTGKNTGRGGGFITPIELSPNTALAFTSTGVSNHALTITGYVTG